MDGFLVLSLSPRVLTYLLHVVVERDSHALLAAEHLTGHECVEDSRASQREAEVEAKQPPVLYFLIKLDPKKTKQNKNMAQCHLVNVFATHFVPLIATVYLY